MTQVDYLLHGPMPTLGFNAEGQVVCCNQAWVYFTGIHADHWLANTWESMQVEDELLVWCSMLQQSGYEGQRIHLHLGGSRSLPCLINLFKHPLDSSVMYVAQAQGLASLVRQFDQDVYSSYEQGRRATEEDFTHRMGNTFSSLNLHTDTLAKQVKVLRKLSDGLQQTANDLVVGMEQAKVEKTQFVLSRAASILTEVTNNGLIEPVKQIRTHLGQVQREVSHKPAFASGQSQKHQQFLLLPLLHDSIDAKVFQRVGLGIDCDADIEIHGVSRNLLIQVIKHIINNSLEAIQSKVDNATAVVTDAKEKLGNVNISVRLESIDAVNWLHISVEDDGCGIGAGQEQRLLEAGYTTKTGHAGNGLHWVANYLQSLGGSLHISAAQKSSGTLVSITLPMDAG